MKDKEKFINEQADAFVEEFRFLCTKEQQSRYRDKPALDVHEMTDDDIRKEIIEFFNKKNLSDAQHHMYHAIDPYVDNPWDKIDHSKDNWRESPEYLQWSRHDDIQTTWSDTGRHLNMDEKWVQVNGRVRSDEAAAKLAADKWCELIFGWHLQDNGAINEDHGGGFYACALGTILGNKVKEGITEDVKKRAHEYFKEYYLHSIHHDRTRDRKDIDWANKMFPDNRDGDRKFDWEYGFGYHSMSCDYGPSTPLYLILVASGVPERDAGSICPWKTTINIRALDNAVMYYTYQNCEELQEKAEEE